MGTYLQRDLGAMAAWQPLAALGWWQWSLLKSSKVKGVRFDTLERICAVLDCPPGDILEFMPVVDE